MKRLWMLVVMGMSAANAHELKAVNQMTNPTLQQFNVFAEKKVDGEYYVTASYRVQRISPVKAGESSIDTMIRVVKSALHRDYPITGDDGGYNLGVLTKESSDKAIDHELEYVETLVTDEDGRKHMDRLKTVVKSQIAAGMVVLVGNGSGNNTSADILVSIDLSTKEFVYLMESNFGRDD